MSTAQVLDRTFSLYRHNFFLFAGIAALPPAMVLVGQLLMMASSALAPRLSGSLPSYVMVVPGVVLFIFVYMLGYALATGATVHAVSRVHLGSPVTIAASYVAVRSLLWRMLGIIILVGLMAGGAFIVCYLGALIPVTQIPARVRVTGYLVPILMAILALAGIVAGIVWGSRIYCRYSLAVPACVVEGLPFRMCMRRSKFLSKQALFRIFLVYLLMLFVLLALSLLLSLPNYVVLAFSSGTGKVLFVEVWNLISSFLAGTISAPFGTVAVALIYYDQRVRKEAFDLELMMEAIAVTPPSPVATAASPSVG